MKVVLFSFRRLSCLMRRKHSRTSFFHLQYLNRPSKWPLTSSTMQPKHNPPKTINHWKSPQRILVRLPKKKKNPHEKQKTQLGRTLFPLSLLIPPLPQPFHRSSPACVSPARVPPSASRVGRLGVGTAKSSPWRNSTST